MLGLLRCSVHLCSLLPKRNIALCSLKYTRTHYEVLDVSRNACKKEVKTAFVNLSKKHHPDVSTDNDSELFIEINDAYTTLIDPVKRTSYDHELNIIEAYTAGNTRNDKYGGSYGYGTPNQHPFTNSMYTGYHGDYSNTEPYFGVHKTGKRHHSRVVGCLVLLMILVTCLHSFRIHWTHKGFQRASEQESKNNHLIYNSVREKAKSRTLEEQLQTLAKKHSEGLNKFSSER